MRPPSRRRFISQALATALSPFYAAGQTGALRVRPVLQNLRKNSVTVTWWSLEAGAGRLEFARRNDPSARVLHTSPLPLAAAETGLDFPLFQHRAELDGLEPAQDYAYAIFINGRLAPGAESLSFRTPGRPGVRLVALGDSGNGSPEQKQLAAMMTVRQPELMLHTGDLVYPDGTVDAYVERFFTPYAPLLARIPVFPCPGNHDYYHQQAKFYVDLHAVPRAGVPEDGHGRYYSFDQDNAHLVVLDSNTPLEEAAEGRGPMLEWLDRDLAATRQFWKIAMFHHPPFAGGPNQDDPLSHLARRFIVPILERHGVQLVLSGHEHNYQRSFPIAQEKVVSPGEGIVYLTTGGGGAELYEPWTRPEAAVQKCCHHFLEAHLEAATLGVRAIGLDGVVFDELRLKPAPRPAAVVNAASFSEGLAPGGLCVLEGRQFAPRDGELASVQLQVDGAPALVVNASAQQVIFVMPAQAAGAAVVTVATANGSASVSVSVLESAPAVFGLEREGVRLGALFHADGEAVTTKRPACTGDELSLYLTGSGRAGLLSVETAGVSVDAVPRPVDHQPGVEVVRFRVPEGAGPLLRLRAGAFASNEIPLWLA